MNPVYLSVVIPAYNEANNLNNSNLEAVYNYLSKRNDPFELILVNDGSTDNTLSKFKAFATGKTQVKIIDNPHQGKALTVKTGMLAAQGEYRLFTDLDQSTPIEEAEKLLAWARKGFDVVIGSREISGARREDEPLHRHIMGKVFNLVVRMMAVNNISDTQCGFKLLTKETCLNLFPKLKVTTAPKADAFTGAFDVELLFLAQKKHYQIKEVPVIWHHIRSQRVNPIKDSWRMFGEVVRIRLASMRGKYDQDST